MNEPLVSGIESFSGLSSGFDLFEPLTGHSYQFGMASSLNQLRYGEDDSISEHSLLIKKTQESQSQSLKGGEGSSGSDFSGIRQMEDLQPSNKYGEGQAQQEPGLKLPQGGRKTLISGTFEGKNRKSLNRRLKRKVNIGLNLT